MSHIHTCNNFYFLEWFLYTDLAPWEYRFCKPYHDYLLTVYWGKKFKYISASQLDGNVRKVVDSVFPVC